MPPTTFTQKRKFQPAQWRQKTIASKCSLPLFLTTSTLASSVFLSSSLLPLPSLLKQPTLLQPHTSFLNPLVSWRRVYSPVMSWPSMSLPLVCRHERRHQKFSLCP
ncbi:hypothetical protein Mapa_001126 [Marchantia paleacea]|nr:hypothetical protein Mapa_001126 [Marchantia paleacea]